MKFARHLQDNQTQEWQKAYIDYRGLKVQLGVIRQHVDTSSSFGNTDTDHVHQPTPNIETKHDDSDEDSSRGITPSTRIANSWIPEAGILANDFLDKAAHESASFTSLRSSQRISVPSFSLAMAGLNAIGTVPIALSKPLVHSRIHRSPHPPNSGFPSPPLDAMLSHLPAAHAKFFEMLDAELCKVKTFYTEKEKELQDRSRPLRQQLRELGIHRQMFYESPANLKAKSWATRTYLSIRLALSACFPNTKPDEPNLTSGNGTLPSEFGRGGGHRCLADTSNFGTRAFEHRNERGDPPGLGRRDEPTKDALEKGFGFSSPRVPDDTLRFLSRRADARYSTFINGRKYSLDPRVYRRAKRRLRKAVAEHYRGLEALNNYRLLNLTGFRKILRKYGKITKTTSVSGAYMKEKVEPCTFASGAMVGDLIKEMEQLFAMRFEKGDRKAAKDHLRAGPFPKINDSSIFRLGLWLGLAVPAISAGSYLAFQGYLRKTLPSWDILLVIYSIFLVPVLMALLICVNILVWARNKINHVFIFKLNPRIRHDYQQYFELPSFLLCTLAYGFWFSMAQSGPPMLWPIVWIALTFAVMFNPFHGFMRGSTRWWTIKKVSKLCASGVWNVEFLDLWLGDQICSLTYSISNLYFVGCFYARYDLKTSAYDPRAQDVWSTCGIAQNWVWYSLLGMFPFFVRFVQSLRRFRDSKLPGQLVNAGKYGMGMVEYLVYCYWRSQNNPSSGKSYIFFCLAATANALYACAWDVLLDWKMCEPFARYPLLRRELVYKSHIYVYYFALISNLCIRFTWLIFIYFDKTSFELRTFIVAMLEMLRRVQWNFYRVENKHLCNVAESRATRELPLPYQFGADTGEEEAYIARLQLKKRLARLS